MNIGIVRTRYAEALVKYVRETGCGEAVCAQAEHLTKVFSEVPDLARMVASRDVVADSRKMELIKTAVGEPMEPALERFVQLLMQNGRVGQLPQVLLDFLVRYRRSIGVRKALLKVACPPPDSLLEELKDLVRRHSGEEALIEVEVDPSLIGGFIFDLDDAVIDTSVASQLERIRLQYIEKNRRIV